MGLVTKPTKTGIWQITGTVAGQRIRKSAKTRDRQAAKLAALILERKIWAGLANGEEIITFEMAANAYMDADKSTRSLRPLILHFAGVNIRQILSGHIEDAARAIYPTAKASTWNRQVITPTRAILNFAAKRGWCSPIRVGKFPEEKVERIAATREWLDAFIGSASPEIGALALFMFTTGARISDALSLEWENVKERRALIRTKTGEREAVLSRELLLRFAALPRNNNRVFRYKSRNSIYNHWYDICDLAGIERIPPHQAGRHAFATEMIVRRGVDVVTTAKLGGWKSPKVLLERYVHPEKLESVVDEVFAAPKPRVKGKPVAK